MKKIFMGSIVLTVFAIATVLFQISCGKNAEAQSSTYTLPPATTSTLGGVIVGSGLSVNSSGVLSVSSTGSTQQNKLIFKRVAGTTAEIWTANYDGSSAARINITLPTGVFFSDDMNPVISPNAQKIFFTAGSGGTSGGDLYSCNPDGTSVTKIVDKGGANNNIILGAAY